MNYKNKKIIFSIISLVMILTIVISPLGSIVSNAETSIGSVVSNPFTVIELPSTMLQRDSLNDHSPFIYGEQYTGDVFTHLETVYDWWLSDGSTMSVRDGQFKWYGEYFVLKGDSNNWNGGYIASVPSGSFFVGYYDYSNNPTYAQYRLYVPKEFIDDNSITKFPMWWSPSMLGTDKYSQFESPNDRTVNVNDSSALVTIDGDQYYYFSNINTQANNFILQTSLPVYVRDNYNFDEISDLGSNVNPNANIDNSVANFETLDESNSGIYLNNSNCNNGTVYVLAGVNNEQADSTNQYKIRYWVDCQYQITIPTNASTDNVRLRTILNNYGMSYSHGTYSLSASYYYDDKPYQEIPCSFFKDGWWTEDFSFTNEKLIVSGSNGKSISSLASFISSGTTWGQSVSDGITNASNILTGATVASFGITTNASAIQSLTSDSYTVDNISYTFHMALYNGDVKCSAEIAQPYQLSANNGTNGRGTTVSTGLATQEEIDEVANTGSGYNTSYAPANDVSVSVGNSSSASSPSNSSSSANNTGSSGGSNNSIGSTTAGDNSIVINNNPSATATATGGSSSGSEDSLLTSLLTGGLIATIFTTISNNNNTSVDNITEITDASGYLDLANTMLGTVPVGFWTVLLTTFTACLGIMVIAFVIKLVMALFLKL